MSEEYPERDRKVGKLMGQIGTLLVVVLMLLKLTSQIEIAWVWVFAPWWIPLLFIGFVIVICGIIAVFMKD